MFEMTLKYRALVSNHQSLVVTKWFGSFGPIPGNHEANQADFRIFIYWRFFLLSNFYIGCKIYLMTKREISKNVGSGGEDKKKGFIPIGAVITWVT